jgi:hypothetical protein
VLWLVDPYKARKRLPDSRQHRYGTTTRRHVILIPIFGRAPPSSNAPRVFSQVSHELITPLKAILGYAEIMRDGNKQKKKKEARGHKNVCRQVLRRGRSLMSLIDGIIRLSQLDEKTPCQS